MSSQFLGSPEVGNTEPGGPAELEIRMQCLPFFIEIAVLFGGMKAHMKRHLVFIPVFIPLVFIPFYHILFPDLVFIPVSIPVFSYAPPEQPVANVGV